jgi:murein DD-endopeptidase MepM/ murein hydrolase activator NlpD
MTTTGALPAVPTGIGTDPEAQQAYVDALSKVAESLENRGGVNWFSAAQGFLDPGRTGSFGESLGKAAGSIGKDLEREKELAPSLAMMRAQIAGQKYTIQNDAKALALMGQTLGVDPNQVPDTLNSGNLNPAQTSKLQAIYPMVASLSPARGEILKNMIGFQNEGVKAGAEASNADIRRKEFGVKYDPNFDISGGTAVPKAPQLPLPVAGATISSPFGERKDPLNPDKTEMHKGIDFAAPLNSPVQNLLPGKVVSIEKSPDGYGNRVVIKHENGASSYYAHLNDINVKEGDAVAHGQPIGTVGSTGKSTGAHVEFGILGPDGKPIDPNPLFSKAPSIQAPTTNPAGTVSPRKVGETVEAHQARIAEENKAEIATGQKFKEEREKQPQVQADEINALGNYKSVSYNNNQLQDLRKLVSNNRDVMDLMNKSNVFSVLGSLVQNGVNTPWGSVSADVNAAIQKALPPEKQAIARQISQYIYEQNQMTMKAGKSIYGPQISNADAVLMAKPGFNPEDPSKYILNMSAKMSLVNKYNGIIADKLDDWMEAHPKESVRLFYKSPEYRNTVDEFNVMHKNLLQGLNYGG